MVDFFDNKKNTVIVNTSIHKKAKLSKEIFLSRVGNFEGLRTRTDYISLFINTEEENHNYLTDLWRLINEGDFRLGIFPNYVLFVVSLKNNFFNWFKNSEIELIRKQICNWISATCLKNLDSKDDILNSLYEPYAKEVQYIIENFYSPDFDEKYSYKYFDPKETNPQEQQNLILERNSEYKSAELKFFKSPPPKELPNPFERNFSVTSYRSLESAFPKIPVHVAYIRDDDWVAIVERDLEKMKEYYGFDTGKSQFSLEDLKGMLSNGENDDMMRAESERAPLKIWRDMFQNDQYSRSNIFDPIGSDLEGGFVYLRKEKDTNYY